jgi:hypothetical protein
MVKHMTSIVDMVLDESKHPDALWEEKIGDAIAYLLCLECITKEE